MSSNVNVAAPRSHVLTDAGGQGFGYGEELPDLTTHKTSVYLVNPAASGKNLYVTSFTVTISDIGAPGANNTVFMEQNVGTPGANTGFAVDKKLTVSTLVAKVYTLSGVAAFGVQTLARVRDNAEFRYPLITPIRILPGRYFGIGTNVTNQATYAAFEWYEL